VAAQAEPFSLTPSSFKDSTPLQQKMAGSNKSNPNCVGDNVSPALSWSNAPNGTKSYALLMIDPEGRNGLGVIHWLAHNIPASVTSFAEGEASKPFRQIHGRHWDGKAAYVCRALHAAEHDVSPLYIRNDRD
jgi:Raf kinase inhibitor-like YbhB/YbcL family protein